MRYLFELEMIYSREFYSCRACTCYFGWQVHATRGTMSKTITISN